MLKAKPVNLIFRIVFFFSYHHILFQTLSIYLSIYLILFTSIYLSIYLSIHIYLSIYLSHSIHIYLSIYVYVCVCVCGLTYLRWFPSTLIITTTNLCLGCHCLSSFICFGGKLWWLYVFTQPNPPLAVCDTS